MAVASGFAMASLAFVLRWRLIRDGRFETASVSRWRLCRGGLRGRARMAARS